jgi:DNA-binding NtrC family response regulator
MRAGSYQPLPVGSRWNVLVVEDDPQVRTLLREILVARGHTATACADRGEAVRVLRARTERIDVILADIGALGKAGLDELQQTITPGWHAHVLLISGDLFCSEVQRVRRELPYPFIGKPFTASELIEGLERSCCHRPLPSFAPTAMLFPRQSHTRSAG